MGSFSTDTWHKWQIQRELLSIVHRLYTWNTFLSRLPTVYLVTNCRENRSRETQVWCSFVLCRLCHRDNPVLENQYSCHTVITTKSYNNKDHCYHNKVLSQQGSPATASIPSHAWRSLFIDNFRSKRQVVVWQFYLKQRKVYKFEETQQIAVKNISWRNTVFRVMFFNSQL